MPYHHCCGSTKTAINKNGLQDYNAHPAWRKFDDPEACAVMGACAPDAGVTQVRCSDKRCALVY